MGHKTNHFLHDPSGPSANHRELPLHFFKLGDTVMLSFEQALDAAITALEADEKEHNQAAHQQAVAPQGAPQA
jgi:hypothetical protein